jgi:hypothetical protein
LGQGGNEWWVALLGESIEHLGGCSWELSGLGERFEPVTVGAVRWGSGSIARKHEPDASWQKWLVGDIAGVQQTIALPAGALAYSFCQVPIVYISAGAPQITISYADGRAAVVAGHSLSADLSQHIFQRDGQIVQLVVQIAP